MKNKRKKALLISILIIAIILGQVGVTNLLSYAQNAIVNKAASGSNADAPNVKISIEKNEYVAMVGDRVEIKANITSTNLIKDGEHPDCIDLTWNKVTGGRPSPFTIERHIVTNASVTSDTLIIESAQVSNTTRQTYMLSANILRWNEKGGANGTGGYEAIKGEDGYAKGFHSAQIIVLVLPELHVDLLKDSKLKGSKEEGYTLQLDREEKHKLNLDLYRLKDENNVNSRMPYERVKSIKWQSSDTNIVEVTNSGELTAKNYSTTPVKVTVTVTDLDDKVNTITVNVTVKTVPVSSVTIDQTDIELEVGEKTTLTATVNPEDASNKTVTWKIADGSPSNIISIDSDTGTITGTIIGETKVVAMAGGLESEECTVTVVETPVKEIVDGLSSTDISLWENKDGSTEEQHSLTIKAEVLPENATNKEITWESSDPDGDIVKLIENADGTVTFTAGIYDENNNECDITASADNGKVKRVYHITVLDQFISVKEIILTTIEGEQERNLTQSDTVELKIGEKRDFNFKVDPENATYKTETWFVAASKDSLTPVNSEIISIDDAGVVTAKAEGTAYVRITVVCQNPECPEHSTYVAVKVIPVPVSSVEIEGEKVEVKQVEGQMQKTVTLEKTDTTTLTAKVLPENATNKTVTWTSSKPEIAEVDSSTGEVTAHKPGSTTITATADGKTDTCIIIVNPKGVEYLEISNITLSVKDNINIGDTKLTVTPYPLDADNFEIKWESEDDSIVEVRADGTVVPKKAGVAVVRARLVSDPEIYVACEVTVVPSKTEVVVYTVDQHIDFISGITLRLTGKDENGTQIEPKELTTNGKFDFGKLPNGEYTIETLIPKTRNALNASEINIIDYVEICKFGILDGEILYTSLSGVHLLHADTLILVNVVDYPDEDEDGLVADIMTGETYAGQHQGQTIEQKYLNSQNGSEQPVNPDNPSIDEAQPNDPEEGPDTSDVPIVSYIVMMMGSFMAITFIILRKNKNLTKKSRK